MTFNFVKIKQNDDGKWVIPKFPFLNIFPDPIVSEMSDFQTLSFTTNVINLILSIQRSKTNSTPAVLNTLSGFTFFPILDDDNYRQDLVVVDTEHSRKRFRVHNIKTNLIPSELNDRTTPVTFGDIVIGTSEFRRVIKNANGNTWRYDTADLVGRTALNISLEQLREKLVNDTPVYVLEVPATRGRATRFRPLLDKDNRIVTFEMDNPDEVDDLVEEYEVMNRTSARLSVARKSMVDYVNQYLETNY